MISSEFAPSLRNGSLPSDAYIFHEIGGIDVSADGRRASLGGVGVEEEARRLLSSLPELSATMGQILTRQQAERSVDGRLLLSVGSWGNGRPFHAHGPALFALAEGTKRWFVRRPNASFEWQTYEVSRDSLVANEVLPAGWQDHIWQCTQEEGDLLWVPDQLPHATLNYAAVTAGLTMVIDEVAALSELHVAAQSGSVSAVLRVLRRPETEVDAPARANGDATPLHVRTSARVRLHIAHIVWLP